VGDAEIEALLQSNTMPVILPGAAFFLSLPYPPAKKMIAAGLPLAIASDFNPGSSPSGNMNLMNAIACIQYGLTPEQTINASTLNGAFAMGIAENYGSIAIGKKANFIITKEIPSLAYIPYAFGSNLIEQVYINGVKYKGY
jgi:imidazolonepropionase